VALTEPAPVRGRPPFFWVVLVLGVLLSGLYPFAVHVLSRYGRWEWTYAWSWARDERGSRVVRTAPDGPAAGKLEVGDRVVAINGDRRVSTELWPHFAGIRPGDSYTVRVARGGEEREYTLALQTSLSRSLRDQVAALLLSFSFYLMGLSIGLLRPEDRVARRAALTGLLSAGPILSAQWFVRMFEPGDVVGWAIARAPVPIFAAVGYDFVSRFPPGVRPGRMWSALRTVLYASGAILCVWLNLQSVLELRGADALVTFVHGHARLHELMDVLLPPFIPFALIACGAVILRNFRLVADPDQSRRLRWVLSGLTVGVLPAALGMLAASQPGLGRFRPDRAALFPFFVLVPISLAYAVLKHRVFGVAVVVRRGVQYLFAKNVLRAALLVPLAALASGLIANPELRIGDVLYRRPWYALLSVATVVALRYRERLTRWVDRRFFREAYDQEQVLLGLIDELRERDSLAEISRLVSERLELALHPQGVHLLFRPPDGAELRLEYSSGAGESLGAGRAGLHMRDDSPLVRALSAGPAARDLPSAGSDGTGEDGGLLRAMGVQLMVPIPTAGGRLAGLLLLGEKRAEEPYAPKDRRLLEAIASQVGMVYENAALKRQVDRDARMRSEVLARLEGGGERLLRECPACGRCYDGRTERCAADGATVVLSLPIERTIDGKYLLERLLGRGGMGSVYEATDLRLDRRIAVKVMSGGGLGSDEARRRFEREARTSARLAHPNIVTVHDYGTAGADNAYLVMELLAGTTLRSEIARRGGLPPAIAAAWLDQIMEGVKAAHAKGVVHRDLKPENVFLARDERGGTTLKVLDFGLAKLKLPDAMGSRSLTVAGTVLGTLAYMSPEQLSGKEVDERTDVFALGAMTFECLTGRNPFVGVDAAQTVAAIFHEPVHLEGEGREVQELDALLQRCLAKDREERFPTVAEMQARLLPVLRRSPPLPGGGRGGPEGDTTLVRPAGG
jgi:hypothetical protein